MNKQNLIILIAVSLFFPLPCFAEQIVFKSGLKINAQIIERTEQYIRIDFQGTPVTYWMYEIESIESSNAAVTSTEKPEEQKPAAVVREGFSYRNKKLNIALTGPPGWLMLADKEVLAMETNNKQAEEFRPYIESGSGFIVVFFKEDRSSPNEQNKPYITLVGFNIPAAASPDISTEVYADSVIEQIASNPLIKVVEGPKKITIGAKDWMRIIVIEADISRMMMYFYLDSAGKIVYTYTATSPKEDFAGYQKEFESALNSIRFE